MKKIFALSFDDGTVQDERLIGLLKKYRLNATFNLSSALFGTEYSFEMNGHHVVHTRLPLDKAAELYRDFEVAAHTRTHNCLKLLPPKDIVEEVVPDYMRLSEIFNRPVRGLAYAWGGVNYDRLAVDVLKNYTSVCYARSAEDANSLAFPENFLAWHPSAHILSDKLPALLDEFDNAADDSLLLVWGHSFELDFDNGWERAEEVLKRLSQSDAECMTCMQVYEYCRRK
ncbi:MAG: hypothetical protein DBX59_07185 [Bacillota bacterium]|nr:MAG: hypothetical protein DBX59_07185 [Bacillota bacterium]